MRSDGYYLGIDIGSVSTNLILTDKNGSISAKLYKRTCGQPIQSLVQGVNEIVLGLGCPRIIGVGVREADASWRASLLEQTL